MHKLCKRPWISWIMKYALSSWGQIFVRNRCFMKIAFDYCPLVRVGFDAYYHSVLRSTGEGMVGFFHRAPPVPSYNLKGTRITRIIPTHEYFRRIYNKPSKKNNGVFFITGEYNIVAWETNKLRSRNNALLHFAHLTSPFLETKRLQIRKTSLNMLFNAIVYMKA